MISLPPKLVAWKAQLYLQMLAKNVHYKLGLSYRRAPNFRNTIFCNFCNYMIITKTLFTNILTIDVLIPGIKLV